MGLCIVERWSVPCRIMDIRRQSEQSRVLQENRSQDCLEQNLNNEALCYLNRGQNISYHL